MIRILKYEMIVNWSEDDAAFVVEVSELPGCIADGPTPHEALASAQVTAAQWIETARSLGREIPQPHGRIAFA